ncbi:MAG: flagellar biosynthesis anti-sigma factor FlgM [Candidatus Acidiferrales bacterium]
MRIGPNLGASQGQGTERATSPENTAASSSASKPLQISNQDSGDQANLSADAQQLSNLSHALNNVPQVRQERVAALSHAVQSGTYAAQNQQIAQSMLRDFRMTSSSSV